jgi:hypothetical protein
VRNSPLVCWQISKQIKNWTEFQSCLIYVVMFTVSSDKIHRTFFCVMTSTTIAVKLNRNYVTDVWSQTDGVWRLLACKAVTVALSSYQLMDSFYLQWTEEARDENISFSFCLLFRARYGRIALLSLNNMLMK